METKNTTGTKPVSELNWFEMKAEATKRGLKTNGVSKQELTVALQKARNAEKAIAEPTERPKHVVVSKDVADVLNAKAIEKRPQLSPKSKQKIEQPKTTTGEVGILKTGVKIRVNENTGLTAQQFADSKIAGDVLKVLNSQTKFHTKVFKLYQIGMTTKQIADQLNSGTGPVHNVIKNYKENPEKIEACNSINI